jgi:hypothetical protein
LGGLQVIEDPSARGLIERKHAVPFLHLRHEFRPTLALQVIRGDDGGGVTRETVHQHEFAAGTRFQAELFLDRIGPGLLRGLGARHPQRGQPEDDDHE